MVWVFDEVGVTFLPPERYALTAMAERPTFRYFWNVSARQPVSDVMVKRREEKHRQAEVHSASLAG